MLCVPASHVPKMCCSSFSVSEAVGPVLPVKQVAL